jgi:peroxisomal coenzyme A diphosphatase NUDT7
MEISTIINKLKNRQPSILGQDRVNEYAVLLPLIEINNEVHILFEVRSMNLRRQPGEICFPGGKIDQSDNSSEHCAIRETAEELGIKQEDINSVIPLDYYVPPLGNIIYPFIGKINDPDKIVPNPSEVGEVFTVPLRFFLETEPETYQINYQVKPEKGFPFDLLIGGENYQWQVKQTREIFYRYEGRVIWGLTAKILTHFLALLHQNGLN